MSLPVSALLKKIIGVETNNLKNIRERLIAINDMGLSKLSLSDELICLDEISAAKIKLASIYFNRIYDIGIVVSNIDATKQAEQEIIKKMLEEMVATNTVWIV